MTDRREFRARCGRLRAKGMYVSGREDRSSVLPYDATIWWCARTQTPVGPDDRPCEAESCSDPRRACFERKGAS